MENNRQEKLLEEIVGLLTILVRRDSLLTTTMREMGGVGFAPKRIAELLNTTPNAVRVTLHQARKIKNKGRNETH